MAQISQIQVAGRRVEIVPPQEVLTVLQIKNERWTVFSLAAAIVDTEESLKWCARRKLLKNSGVMCYCNRYATLWKRNTKVDGFMWCCGNCNFTKSVREGSFFSRSKLPIQKILLLIYLWSRNASHVFIREELVIARATLVDWCNFLRDEFLNWKNRNPIELGGCLDANGDPVVVEMDESVFRRAKYNRGRFIRTQWVFGGVERGSNRVFIVPVPDRSAATLLPIIQRHVLPGTHIITDGWHAYTGLDQYNNGVYIHSVVVPEHNFVDPIDKRIHTQTMIGVWSHAKKNSSFKMEQGRLFSLAILLSLSGADHIRTCHYFVQCL